MNDGKNHFKFWSAVVAIIVLTVALAWSGRSVYRHFKEKHSVAEARAFLAQGDGRSAFLSVRQALLINSNNVEACRIMAALQDSAGSPAAIDWRQRVAEIEPTLDNKLMLAAAGLRYQKPPFPLTTQTLDDLTATATNNSAFYSLLAELDSRMNRAVEMQLHLEEALQLEPTNQLLQLRLAAVRLGSTNPPVAAAARGTIKQFEQDTNFNATAFRLLVMDRLLHDDWPGARNYSTQLLANVQATVDDRLQYAGILRHMNASEFPAQLALLRESSATNAATTAKIASWMTANGLAADTVQWLTNLPAQIQAQPPVRLALADGYVARTNWTALLQFTAQGDWDEMDFVRLALLSHASAELGKQSLADANWQSAVNQAGSRPAALSTLLELAKRWELKQKRDDLLWQIVQKFPHQLSPRQELAGDYFLAGDTQKLNRLYSVLLPFASQDSEIKNNLAATSLLLKTDLPAAFKLAQEAYAQKPDDPSYVSTYAYALYLQGRTQDGVAAMEKLGDQLLQRPATALYYGVLLSALGEKAKAAPFLAIAEKDGQLLPEEKQLLSQARQAK